MKKFEDLTEIDFTEQVEKALNVAINGLDVHNETNLVFELIKIKPATPIAENCRIEKVCKIQDDGSLICKWEIVCD